MDVVSEDELRSILGIFVSLQPMKELRRQGAIYYGERMMEADTIAGHSFTVASLAWMLARQLKNKGYNEINIERVLTMSLCHDMGETLTGDIGVAIKKFGGRELFEKIESTAFAKLVEKLADKKLKDELRELLEEYNNLSSKEAKIVKVADRLDAWSHALGTPSVSRLIQAWGYYNKNTYDKIKESGDSFACQLAELFMKSCELLIEMVVIILDEEEIKFRDPEWPVSRQK